MIKGGYRRVLLFVLLLSLITWSGCTRQSVEKNIVVEVMGENTSSMRDSNQENKDSNEEKVSNATANTDYVKESSHKESDNMETSDDTEAIEKSDTNKEQNLVDNEGNEIKITISAAGDCTLGSDDILNQYSYKTFMEEYEDQNHSKTYFFENVSGIFKEDDLTIVNLETTLTTATKKASKKYRFKGLPEFNDILVQGNIDVVSLANNHTYDYLKEGYLDTMKYLKEAEIGYFGNSDYYITEIKGIKIGLLGYTGWAYGSKVKEKIKKHMDKLKEEGCQLIIVSFHWGEEYNFYPNGTQKKLGHYVIDEGADLVLGHHPHVIQGIEEYNNKYIVYSLGNFCFGGNLNPKDKDTFIFQQTFSFDNLEKVDDSNIKIIPCSVSSTTDRNDFKPTPLVNEDYIRVINRINEYSKKLNFNYAIEE